MEFVHDLRELKRRYPFGALCLCLYLFALAYGASYYALLKPEVMGMRDRYASYQFGGQVSQVFFAPAHGCDRAIRPDYWHDSSGNRK